MNAEGDDDSLATVNQWMANLATMDATKIAKIEALEAKIDNLHAALMAMQPTQPPQVIQLPTLDTVNQSKYSIQPTIALTHSPSSSNASMWTFSSNNTPQQRQPQIQYHPPKYHANKTG